MSGSFTREMQTSGDVQIEVLQVGLYEGQGTNMEVTSINPELQAPVTSWARQVQLQNGFIMATALAVSNAQEGLSSRSQFLRTSKPSS